MNNIENINIVVALLKNHNIRYIVTSPGGTNIALVSALQNDSFFKCFSIVDERSAVYFAIGLHLQTGESIAMSCTSAQATRNYIPGLTEAYYKQVPILAITMSKLPRFTYQSYMQAPNQISRPVDCVKKSYTLPIVQDTSDYLEAIIWKAAGFRMKLYWNLLITGKVLSSSISLGRILKLALLTDIFRKPSKDTLLSTSKIS